jgi:hypothetical protein
MDDSDTGVETERQRDKTHTDRDKSGRVGEGSLRYKYSTRDTTKCR